LKSEFCAKDAALPQRSAAVNRTTAGQARKREPSMGMEILSRIVYESEYAGKERTVP
jgi:hypothetical protein